jgi:ABC-type branched-subunit amino acid transport system substrate-binding protein
VDTIRKRWAAGVLVLGLVATACGGDHDSDASSTSASSGSTAATETTAAGATSTTASPDGDTSTPASTETTAAGATFGTLPSPCGPGDASGATATGVTDTSITIGYGDDSDYPPAPGLTREMGDVVRALIEWCNEQGGINGREIVGNYYDAKLLQVSQAMTQACNDEVFMLVAQGWALDAGQEQLRIDCQLATIPTYSVSTAFAHGPGMVQPVPNPGDQGIAAAAFQLAELFPDAVTKVAFVFAEYPPTRETRDKYAASYPEAGWTFLDCDQIYNIAGESDWKPFAENMKACGAQAVAYVGSAAPNFENLLAASQQVGFEPEFWFADANNYDAGFAEWNGQNGNAADTVYVRNAFVPFELAGEVPAVQQLIDLVTDADGKLALLSSQAASAFLLWATAAQACGSELTPKCVLERAAEQTAWTGGGLHTETNPGANDGPTCGMLLKLDGPNWVKAFPEDELFDCDDRYLVKGITTSALEAAQLDADRVATQFGTFTPA